MPPPPEPQLGLAAPSLEAPVKLQPRILPGTLGFDAPLPREPWWRRITKRTAIGLVLVVALMVAFLGGSRLASVQNKQNVLNVLNAGPISFREHVSTYGVDPAVAWIYSGYNLWLGNAIGMTFAILIGAALVALVVPRNFVEKVLARRGTAGSAVGGALGSALFMCANCATPVSMGYYRRGASLETALSVIFASPLLNIVGLVTIFFLLPSEMGVWRVAASVGIVLGLPPLIKRLAGPGLSTAPATLEREMRVVGGEDAPEPLESWPRALLSSGKMWGRTMSEFGWRFLPMMLGVTWGIALLATFVLTPELIRDTMGGGFMAVVVASAIGTLLVTSTMMEIPIVLGFLLLGMGQGPATAMLVTLPATSIMVAAMMGRETGWRVPLVMLGLVFAVGVGVGTLVELL